VKSRAPADVVVVGAGPAGLAAASAAAERGRRVLVIDQGLKPGGQIWRHQHEADLPRTAQRLMARARRAGVTIASEARLVDVASSNELIVDFRGRIDTQQTGALIIASGARERFIPFPGWTLPGVVGVGGLQALLKGGLSVAGARVVIAGTGPLLFPVAAALARAGAQVLVVAEQASRAALMAFGMSLVTSPDKMAQAMRYRGAFLATPFRTASWVVRAHGHERLAQVVLQERGRLRTLDCDWLATSAGLVPVTDVAELAGCALDAGAVRVDAQQATTVSGVWAAGECTGVKGDAAAMVEGEIAGRAAAGDARGAADRTRARERQRGLRFAARIARTFAPRAELLQLADDATVICRCEDVRRGAIDPAWTQRQAKLWTRVGMGACQGAVCGPACAALFGWEGNTVRPPIGGPACGAWRDALDRIAPPSS
jgi:NADPH-dependent 2,4-dienoyl-CoA reductase/sulfur reductase-like enzyme